MNRILGIAGRKGAGKSTAAALLPVTFCEVHFATALKDGLQTMLGLSWAHLWGDRKEEPIDWLDGVTTRHIMQVFGTGAGRSVHPDLWVRVWRREADKALAEGYDVVAADVRFPNEAAAIRDLGGVVIWVERPGLPATDGHASENSLGPADCDRVVVNDGDEDVLRRRVGEALA